MQRTAIVHRSARRAQAPFATLLALVVLASSGCNMLARPDAGPEDERAEALAREGDHDGAALVYQRLARQSTGERRDALLMLSAEQWYAGGDRVRAEQTLAAATGPLPEATSPAGDVLAAAVLLHRQEPEQALARLERLPPELPPVTAGDALAVEASARFALADPVAGVEALMARELWLDSRDQVLANHRLIWRGLGRTGEVPVPPGADATLAGWLELGNAAGSASGDPFDLRARLREWRLAHPAHPASEGLLDLLLGEARRLMQFPRQVAVLLPLTGRLESAGAAVRDGFLAAYFAHDSEDGRPAVALYDTNALGPELAYRNAMEGGADFIVGPLTKTAVATVAPLADFGVPTLALNYLPDEAVSPPSFFQFALAPEHEAWQAGERAAAEGLLRAVALVPDTPWGMRLLDAFTASLNDYGGTLLEFATYNPVESDFSEPIRRVLHLDRSRQRYRELAGTLGFNVEFEPRRRQDVQAIFVAAGARQGRLLRPQLRYHYASDLPVFATADVHQPEERAAHDDLDGLVFADMPWALTPSTAAPALRETLAATWPGRLRQRSRLYAMGHDAYRLVPLLFNAEAPLATPFPGLTGELTTDASGRVQRRLHFARIENGVATPLPDIEPPRMPLELPAELDFTTLEFGDVASFP